MTQRKSKAPKAKAAPVKGAVQWSAGPSGARSVIVAEHRLTPGIQAGVWGQAITHLDEAREAAFAIRHWRRTHSVLAGDVVLDVLAISCADAVYRLAERMEAFLDVSPRLRVAVEGQHRPDRKV